MKSTQWLTSVTGLFGITSAQQAFEYENPTLFANNQQQAEAGDGQSAPVQNSWSSDDLGYAQWARKGININFLLFFMSKHE